MTAAFEPCCTWNLLHLLVNELSWTVSAAATRCGVARATVRRMLARRDPPSHSRDPPRLAKKKVIHIKNRRRIVVLLAEEVTVKERHRGKTARSQLVLSRVKTYPTLKSIRAALSRLHGIEASEATIARDLTEAGFRSKTKPKRPVVVDGDHAIREIFCRTLLLFRPLRTLRRIVFSDEKLALCSQAGGKKDWTRGAALPLAYDQGSPRIMLHAVLGVGIRRLIFIDGGVTEEVYLKCLNLHRDLLQRPGVVFQYDNAQAHLGSNVAAWLKTNRVTTFEDAFGVAWPARCPFFSVIENAWAIVQHRVHERHMPMNLQELKDAWATEWYGLEEAIVVSLVESFTARLEQWESEHRPQSPQRA